MSTISSRPRLRPKQVVRAVNHARPGTAKLVSFANMNHQLELYPSPEATMGPRSGMTAGGLAVAESKKWLDEVLQR